MYRYVCVDIDMNIYMPAATRWNGGTPRRKKEMYSIWIYIYV